jgi:hypothetical protein
LEYNTQTFGNIPTGVVEDLFPGIREDFKGKFSILRGLLCDCSFKKKIYFE